MTRAMLLSAGLGTRLGALSDERPKPMLPVCNLPILRYGIALLAGHGIRDIVINLHHRAEVIEDELGDGSAQGVRLQYVRERDILGTGGGLKNALPLLDPDGADEPFVSLNGKLIFDLDLSALLAAYERAGDALGMMAVRRVPDALSWGAVDVDTSAPVLRVRDILGAGGFMFGGVHVTRPSVVRRLPEGEACMVRQGYLPWLRDGELVAAFEAGDGYFAEHSTPARYLQSNLDILGGTRLRFPPTLGTPIDPCARVDASVELRPPVRIQATAEIGAGAVLGPGVVVGAGAVIGAGALLERCVVWRGARVEPGAVLRDCIVTPRGVVDASEDAGE
ncbi:nucleotidyltransferase family protein [Haliangium ochraceum]|uniref:Nucleotidyl transferase n=1 Tax=Haliangium ochraceum (strain DSM 14365 / JCM 11303 / SMP-2) TaxID=502025 RepID=D0LUB6_HALO1|nr:NDP-sugar synthase [Haliangium ochraceum]ACY19239.1 Nucleotidyl transferase [Haliangium ochraceum DSM 14365]